jgi:hypothetical protein
MKRLGALMAMTLAAAFPAAAAPRTVTGAPILIENAGRSSIYNLYAVEQGRSRWGRDRFEDATIPVGRSREVILTHRPGRCLHRLKLVLAGGREIVRPVDLCRGGHWRIDAEGDTFASGPIAAGRR